MPVNYIQNFRIVLHVFQMRQQKLNFIEYLKKSIKRLHQNASPVKLTSNLRFDYQSQVFEINGNFIIFLHVNVFRPSRFNLSL